MCRHHPGAPIFHDAHKRWSCCKKGSVDFTEFLNIAGCAYGRHNSEKPAPPAAPVQKAAEEKEVVIVKAPLPDDCYVLAARPSSDARLVQLPTNIDSKLSQSLAAKLAELEMKSASDNGDADSKENVQINDSCQNKSCTAKYLGTFSNAEICHFHPGFPVFHEGMKYWSCCQRKTTEFDSFLAQEGCAQGTHNWKKPARVVKTCRVDWHQGKAGHVTVDLYAKLATAERCEVQANGVRLSVRLVYDAGQAEFTRSWDLHGVINPEESVVNFRSTKVEVCLKKRDPMQWPVLELKKSEPVIEQQQQ